MRMFYLLKPCKTSAAFEATPGEDLHLNIDKCAEILKRDYEIVANARIMLVIKDKCEISIHRSGKLVIKTDSEDIAREEAVKIYESLG